MRLWSLALLLALCTITAIDRSARAESPTDLGDAFRATFGQAAPVTRHVDRPVYDIDLRKIVGLDSIEMVLWPDRLIRVDDERWALITRELSTNNTHSSQGAIAVAYLRLSDNGWTLEHSWPEIFYSGVGGEPANVGEEVRRYGSTTLFLATGEWCGMGSCSDGIDVVSLTQAGAVYLGDVLGGAEYSADPDIDPDNDSCGDYSYTVVVGPPTTTHGIFSVTYDGWTAPPQARTTKTHFHLTADAVPSDNVLKLRPYIPVPVCGR